MEGGWSEKQHGNLQYLSEEVIQFITFNGFLQVIYVVLLYLQKKDKNPVMPNSIVLHKNVSLMDCCDKQPNLNKKIKKRKENHN